MYTNLLRYRLNSYTTEVLSPFCALSYHLSSKLCFLHVRMFRLSAYDEWYPTKQGFSLTGPFLNDFLDFIEQFDFTKEFSKVNEDLSVNCIGNTVTFMMQKLLGVTVITLEE